VSGRRVFWQIGVSTQPICIQEITVTALSQSTKRKLSLLQLADELGNVARACKIMGYHRDTFYEVRRAFQMGGVAALVEQRRGARGPHPNRIAPEIEERVLAHCLTWPTHGAQRVSNDLRLAGVEVSPSGVRGVWLRNDLETRYKRLMRLERESRENTTFVLTDAQILLLDRHSPDFRCRHVESSAPGELLNQDTFYWGTLKGVGKVYVQVVVDMKYIFTSILLLLFSGCASLTGKNTYPSSWPELDLKPTADGCPTFLLRAIDGSLIVQLRSDSLGFSAVVVGTHLSFDSIWFRYPSVEISH
jgi:hypothetical protein